MLGCDLTSIVESFPFVSYFLFFLIRFVFPHIEEIAPPPPHPLLSNSSPSFFPGGTNKTTMWTCSDPEPLRYGGKYAANYWRAKAGNGGAAEMAPSSGSQPEVIGSNVLTSVSD